MVPGTRERLSRGRILRAALDLIDREGLDALSMRRLGQELGVEAMSLYHHVPNKAALLGDLVEGLLAEIAIPDEESDVWTERARALARSYRRLAHDHPHAFPLLVTWDLKTPGALRLIDAMVDVCRGAGYGEQAALDAFSTIAGYATGYALFEIGGLFQVAAGEAGAPPGGAWPGPPAGGTPLFDHGDEQFEFGLDAILAGLQAKLGEPGGAAPSDVRR